MSLPTHGLHDGIDETEYHRDPSSLSSTGAKTLLYRGPAIYQWERSNPVHKDAFDLGSVVHALILGVGDYQVIDADSWRTKAAQEERTAARVAGKAPILAKDYTAAVAMRDAVMDNGIAAHLLAEGRPEVSMWATDPETGVVMRGRADWLRTDLLVDLKTTAGSVASRDWTRAVWDRHYHLQAAWYERILHLNGLDLPPLVWLVVSKDRPYEVAAYQADQDLMDRGRDDVARALRLYADCIGADWWPPLTDPDRIHTISAPSWA